MVLITFHSNSTKKYKKVEQKNNILFSHKKRVLKNMSTQTNGEENRTLFASESQLAAIFGLSSLQYLYIATSFAPKISRNLIFQMCVQFIRGGFLCSTMKKPMRILSVLSRLLKR